MADQSLRILLRRLGCAAAGPGAGALSDAQLLERFVAHRDEAAFELLVWRHGTMVLNVCRRLLRHEQDAEDAFQATFLILARKAGSIGKRQACAGWLYKVAYRVALTGQADTAARPACDGRCTDQWPAAEAVDDLAWQDLRPVLDEEVRRLPEKYRAAFVLCCLEGRTGAEAAEQLRCPKGTVLSRLSRARERLRRRLLRRGISLAVGALAALTEAHGQAAEITAGLVAQTAKAALTIGAARSARVAALTEGVLRSMVMSKAKAAVGIVLTIGILGIVAGLVGNALLADPGQVENPRPAAGPQDSQRAAPEKPVAPGQESRPNAQLRAALDRLESQRKLRQIGIAVNKYVDAYRRLPAPAIYQGYPDGLLPVAPAGKVPAGGGSILPGASGAGGPGDGPLPMPGAPAVGPNAKALLSWRVALLPFMGEDKLYRQFKRDEPWDSEHNRKLLAQMPAVYAAPGAKADHRTYYQALVGTGAAWEPRRQLRFPASIPDGTSNTILVVEAGSSVPWTKPEDLPYVSDQALPKLGGLFGGDFHALFADGGVRFLSAKADEQLLRYAIMPADGYPIDFDKLLARSDKGAKNDADPNDLRHANEQLRKAIDAIEKMAAKEKAAVEALRTKLDGGRPKLNAEAAGLREENAKLQRALDRAMDDVEKLRAEKRRLELDLQQPQRKPQKE